MSDQIGDVEIDGGTILHVIRVGLPDDTWGPVILRMLDHKEPVYLAHISAAQAGRTAGLQTTFYLGVIDSTVVATFMVASSGRFGILGHVLTMPDFRRRGISSKLLEVGLAAIDRTDVTDLALAVTPDSPASRIYEKVGFSAASPTGDGMVRSVPPTLTIPGADDYEIAELDWCDWPGLNWALLSAAADDEPTPRAALLGVDVRGQAEGTLLSALVDDAGRDGAFVVLRGPDGSVVGWSYAHADVAEPHANASTVWELHVLAGHEGLLPALIASAGPGAICYAWGTRPATYRAALESAGFERELPAADSALPYRWVRRVQ